jgi:5'-nucleotidase
VFYNVNFPPCSAQAVKGKRVAAQGFRRDVSFGVQPYTAPSGKRFLWIKGGPQATPTLPGTDAHANLDGYISITPLRCDLTAHDLLADLTEKLA